MHKQHSLAGALLAASAFMLIVTGTALASSQAPQSELPKAELPQVEPSQVEPSQVEPPQAELPQVEPPQAELPKPELPKPELPQAEAAQPASPELQYEAVIASPLRTEADRQNDARRKPAEFLAFAQVTPGMKVLDLGSGTGATAALLAAAVTPDGEVWAHNSRVWPELDARVAGGILPNVRMLVGPFENPIPKNLPPLDLITMNMAYHDVATFLPNRLPMNRRMYSALKPGGYLVIIDNAGKPGTGVSETATLHRIDEETVVAELIQAGFVLDARSDYLRATSDPRELPYFQMAGAADDKFALRFVKKIRQHERAARLDAQK